MAGLEEGKIEQWVGTRGKIRRDTQANKPYGTKEGFRVCKVSAVNPVRLQTAPTGPGGEPVLGDSVIFWRSPAQLETAPTLVGGKAVQVQNLLVGTWVWCVNCGCVKKIVVLSFVFWYNLFRHP